MFSAFHRACAVFPFVGLGFRVVWLVSGSIGFLFIRELNSSPGFVRFCRSGAHPDGWIYGVVCGLQRLIAWLLEGLG